ncbi:MAG: cupin protein, partial [Clostridia bacterium]|nr:cupin protein [Clostridia bacterium]
DAPHEGEEFGYVIAGNIYVHLGNKKFKAKKGDSFYFRPTSDHYLHNTGKTRAMILWVASPPSF